MDNTQYTWDSDTHNLYYWNNKTYSKSTNTILFEDFTVEMLEYVIYAIREDIEMYKPYYELTSFNIEEHNESFFTSEKFFRIPQEVRFMAM